jgi:GntR family transcriptional regulator
MPINRSDATPLHRQIQEEIRGLIENRTLEPGEKLPTELQLAEMFDVNRLTIRHAVAELRRQGLVIARQGVGTFVAALPPPLEIELDPDDWLVEQDRGMRAARESGRQMEEQLLICGHTDATGEPAKHLGTGRLLWMETRHVIDGLPSIRSQYWMRSDLSLNEVRERCAEEMAPQVMTEIVGQRMYYAWRSFDAIAADARTAELLDVAVGVPLLRRCGLNSDAAGAPLLYLQRDAPSGRMTIIMRSQPPGD